MRLIFILSYTAIAGCQLFAPKPAERAANDLDPDTVLQNSAYALNVAREAYNHGEDAPDSPKVQSFFRQECRLHETDREALLDQMHERAGIHAFAWRDYYERRCSSPALPQATEAVDARTGETLISNLPYLCPVDADAGAASYPAQAYDRSPEEKLAQRQRDACERAQ